MGIISAVSRPVWQRRRQDAPASSTTVIDQIVNDSFVSATYKLVFSNQAQGSFKKLDLEVVNNNGTYTTVVSGKVLVGSASLSINVTDNSGIMEISVTNAESFNLTVDLARLILN